jgi:prepilin-type N-terminal cleavage/methylation domain-containing protein
MSTQKKQGFTLIELMVVIVIIGILAAVAIPKLFGMSAKAKASELAPAAGTWIKLQQAYHIEMEVYGNYTQIAYTTPNSNVFSYPIPTSTSDSKGQWEAEKKPGANLGDCNANDPWISTISTTSNETTITAEYPDDDDGKCEAISPGFKNLRNP